MLETLIEKHWYHLSLNDVLTLLETDGRRGLDSFEVAHRQKQFGPNILTPHKGTSPFVLFLLQFHQPLVYILLAATLITALLQEWVDSGVIFGVVLMNAFIGYIQESKALKAIEALAQTMEGMTTVIRAGQKERISVGEIVPGDLVALQSGDKVPADLRTVDERNLQIDESAFTGESIPVLKQVHVLPKKYGVGRSSQHGHFLLAGDGGPGPWRGRGIRGRDRDGTNQRADRIGGYVGNPTHPKN